VRGSAAGGREWGRTNSIGNFAEGIVAQIKIAEALTFYDALGERSQQVVREGESASFSNNDFVVDSTNVTAENGRMCWSSKEHTFQSLHG
jgi:hypothetical protein